MGKGIKIFMNSDREKIIYLTGDWSEKEINNIKEMYPNAHIKILGDEQGQQTNDDESSERLALKRFEGKDKEEVDE